MQYIEPKFTSFSKAGAFNLDRESVDRLAAAMGRWLPVKEAATVVEIERVDGTMISCTVDELDDVNIHMSDFKSVRFNRYFDGKSISVNFNNKQHSCFVYISVDNAKLAEGAIAPVINSMRMWYAWLYEPVTYGLKAIVIVTFGAIAGWSIFGFKDKPVVAAAIPVITYLAFLGALYLLERFSPAVYFNFGTIGVEMRKQKILGKILAATVCFIATAIVSGAAFLNDVTDLGAKVEAHPKPVSVAAPPH